MRELGVGIIGCGSISTTYLRNLPLFAGLRVVACADLRAEAAASQAGRFGIAALGVEALLRRDDIDLVVNLTNPKAHFEVGMAVLGAGKHLYGEKPLAATLAEGRRLVEAAEARGLMLGCAPDTFLGPGARLARRVLDQGRIGRVLAGSVNVLSHGMEHWHPDPEFYYLRGGGPVLDLGPYHLTALVNLLGPIARVQAIGGIGLAERVLTAPGPRQGQRIRPEEPTTVLGALEFAAGARVSLAMSWEVWKHRHPAIELYGSEGTLSVPDPNFFAGVVECTARDGEWAAEDSSAMAFGRPNYRSPSRPPSAPLFANYRGIGLAEMASAALNGTPRRCDGRLALHVLAAMEAILRAVESGETVAVEAAVERPPALGEDEARALARPGGL